MGLDFPVREAMMLTKRSDDGLLRFAAIGSLFGRGEVGKNRRPRGEIGILRDVFCLGRAALAGLSNHGL